MTQHLTPLGVAECLLGTIENVALVSGYDRKSAYPWRHSTKSRGAGDLPSAIIMRRLLAYSDAHNLGLTAEHLILGADKAEIDGILAARVPQQVAAE